MSLPIKKSWHFLIVLTAVTLCSLSAFAGDKPWQIELVSDNVKAACDEATKLTLGEKDIPSPSEQAELKGCNSSSLYYGLSGPVDYLKARRCASLEKLNGDGAVISGSMVLMMIYANGYGVDKNLDLAIKLACESGGAPAEIDGRVEHLEKLKTKPEGQLLEECSENKDLPEGYCEGKFDVCDDLTSGFMQGVCATIISEKNEPKNKALMDTLVTTWPHDHQSLFHKLEASAKDYFKVHSESEIDLSGSGRVAFSIEEQDTMLEKFRSSIKNFEAGKIPNFSTQDLESAERELNTTYTDTLSNISKDDEFMGITKNGLKESEKSWKIYRDAWVRFAALHYPKITPATLKAWLTYDRLETIRNIPSTTTD